MNKFKFYIFYLLIISAVTSCGTVKKAFDSERKNSSDEFLVEKKSPLSLPPEFNELPVPDNNSVKVENKENEIKNLILENKEDLPKNQKINKNLELLILEKIN